MNEQHLEVEFLQGELYRLEELLRKSEEDKTLLQNMLARVRANEGLLLEALHRAYTVSADGTAVDLVITQALQQWEKQNE